MLTFRKSALFIVLSLVFASTGFQLAAIAQIGVATSSDKTSPSGSSISFNVSSPWTNEAVSGKVTVKAAAKSTPAFWAIYNSGNLVYFDPNPISTLSVPISLTTGLHTVRIDAIDYSGTPSTVKVPVNSASSGVHVKWEACMRAQNGHRYQAMKIFPKATVTGVLQGQLFYGSGCKPSQWTDQLNDYGTTMSFGSGTGWTFWFVNRADQLGTSAVWTMGNQSSGCVNYSTAPAC